jgi:hypothetical protein
MDNSRTNRKKEIKKHKEADIGFIREKRRLK